MEKSSQKTFIQLLSTDDAHTEIVALTKKISSHDVAYYEKDQSLVSDAEYDEMRKRLLELEFAFPELKQSDSPSNVVGAKIKNTGFAKRSHSQPMLSLGNGFTANDIANFLKRVRKFLNLNDDVQVDILTELKIDGLSVAIHYKNGVLTHAITRGDGAVGEDVTANIKTIQDIPHRLQGNFPEFVEIRGEIYMEIVDFHTLNQSLEEAGKKPFASPRHGAAGSLRQLDAGITAARRLRFFAFDWGSTILDNTDCATNMFAKMASWGVRLNPFNRLCDNLEEILSRYGEIGVERGKLAYEIDGMVYKLNALGLRERLGFVARAPRWAIAHKFPAEKKQTILKDITIQVGRTGVLTPVAELEPVVINGVRIARATLYNADEIRNKKLRIGDMVELQRAGDVIPQITQNISAKTRGEDKESDFQFPTHCPKCGAAVEISDNGKLTRCPAKNSCPAQNFESLKHFVSKAAFDIEGLGEKNLALFLDKGWIQNAADIFKLHEKREELLSLEGFQEKSVNNLLENIEASRQITLARSIYALGIRNIGIETAKTLAQEYKNISEFLSKMQALNDENELARLENIDGIGSETQNYIAEFFNAANVDIILTLITELDVKNFEQKQGIFNEKTLLFTGTLVDMGRAEAKQKVENLGGKVVSFVSKNLDFLVVGENPGSKRKKAEELGIKILDEHEFLELAKQ